MERLKSESTSDVFERFPRGSVAEYEAMLMMMAKGRGIREARTITHIYAPRWQRIRQREHSHHEVDLEAAACIESKSIDQSSIAVDAYAPARPHFIFPTKTSRPHITEHEVVIRSSYKRARL